MIYERIRSGFFASLLMATAGIIGMPSAVQAEQGSAEYGLIKVGGGHGFGHRKHGFGHRKHGFGHRKHGFGHRKHGFGHRKHGFFDHRKHHFRRHHGHGRQEGRVYLDLPFGNSYGYRRQRGYYYPYRGYSPYYGYYPYRGYSPYYDGRFGLYFRFD